MKVIKILLVLFFIGFTVSCARVYDVKYDFDQQANFADLKAFDWMRVPESARINSQVVERVKNSVNAELKVKGLMMSSNDPDFLIALHLGRREKVQVTGYGYGYDSSGGYGSALWGPGGAATYDYEEGTLILDFVDATSKKMIWRGAAKTEVQV